MNEFGLREIRQQESKHSDPLIPAFKRENFLLMHLVSELHCYSIGIIMLSLFLVANTRVGRGGNV